MHFVLQREMCFSEVDLFWSGDRAANVKCIQAIRNCYSLIFCSNGVAQSFNSWKNKVVSEVSNGYQIDLIGSAIF